MDQETSNQFITVYEEFIDSCKDMWTNDLDLTKTSIGIKTTVKPYPEEVFRAVRGFYEHLIAPIPASVHVPYAKAFYDITGTSLSVLALIHYGDMERALTVADMTELDHVHVKWLNKYQNANKKTQKIIKKVFIALAELSLQATKNPDPRSEYPTQQAISDNIEKRREEKKMLIEARNTTIDETERNLICEAISHLEGLCPPEGIEQYNPDTLAKSNNTTKVCEAWQSIKSEEARKAIRDRSFKNLVACVVLDPLNVLNLPEAVNRATKFSKSKPMDKFWETISKEASFSNVRDHIPVGIMENIEKQAQSMIERIQNGDMSFADIDINTIGETVMQNCSAADIEALSENIPSVLPELQGMMKGMDLPGGINLQM